MKDFILCCIFSLTMVCLFRLCVIEAKLDKLELNMRATHYADMLSNQGDGVGD